MLIKPTVTRDEENMKKLNFTKKSNLSNKHNFIK